MIRIELGKCLLQKILNERHMTQTDLEVLTGIVKQQLNDYIKNRKKMSLPTAILVAKVLKCNVTDLYEIKIITGRH
jgi:DNA-binding XRE family transcriptional regulator